LSCLLDFLGNQIGRLTGGQVPLLCFVNRLIPLIKLPTLRDNLKQWIETVGESCFRLSHDEIKKLLESEPPLENSAVDRHQTLSPVLSIVVEPAEKQEVIAKAWFKAETKPLVTKSLKAENWQEEISNIVKTLLDNKLDADDDDDGQNVIDPLTIEFFLPKDWLCHAIELLTPENCNPIGVDCRVITRSQERLTNKVWRRNWNRHWNRCQGILQSAPNTCVAWLEKPSQDFYSLLEEGRLFFILAFVPEPGELINLIKAGMPMALWARQTDAEISQELQNFLACDKLEKLSELVRRKRQTTWVHSGQQHLGHFSLFWDNPNQLPYKLQKLQTPS